MIRSGLSRYAKKCAVGRKVPSQVGITAGARLQSNAAAALSLSNINQNVVEAEYAVRGAIVLRALEHEKTLAA